VVRHTTRYGLPAGTDYVQWLLGDGRTPALDEAGGRRRARAATMFMLALPGAAYLYQGEELGLPEVADLPAAALQDPIWLRTGNTEKGRDGCRVPLPWSADGDSYGFGSGSGWLPQPAGFAPLAVAAQLTDPDSTLQLYRQALRLRRELQTAETLEWLPTGSPDVLHVARPGGWQCVTNFGTEPVALPAGTVLVASGPAANGVLPGETAAWLIRD
jgi:alpha-glucosidase